jgi:hypothetical protein
MMKHLAALVLMSVFSTTVFAAEVPDTGCPAPPERAHTEGAGGTGEHWPDNTATLKTVELKQRPSPAQFRGEDWVAMSVGDSIWRAQNKGGVARVQTYRLPWSDAKVHSARGGGFVAIRIEGNPTTRSELSITPYLDVTYNVFDENGTTRIDSRVVEALPRRAAIELGQRYNIPSVHAPLTNGVSFTLTDYDTNEHSMVLWRPFSRSKVERIRASKPDSQVGMGPVKEMPGSLLVYTESEGGSNNPHCWSRIEGMPQSTRELDMGNLSCQIRYAAGPYFLSSWNAHGRIKVASMGIENFTEIAGLTPSHACAGYGGLPLPESAAYDGHELFIIYRDDKHKRFSVYATALQTPGVPKLRFVTSWVSGTFPDEIAVVQGMLLGVFRDLSSEDRSRTLLVRLMAVPLKN